MLKFTAAIAVLAAASALPAAAATYDVVTGFDTAGSPTSVFKFGTGFGTVFSALPVFAADNCLGTPGLACYETTTPPYNFPAVAKNISRSDPLTFYTNVLPKSMLFIQSDSGTVGTVRFTAPTTSIYTFSGSFTRIDSNNGAGDGVVAGAFVGTTFVDSGYIPTVYGSVLPIAFTTLLTAGSTADFYLDALSNTNNDGTGIMLTATYVPEPATWALMIAGFGLVGIAGRRRAALAA